MTDTITAMKKKTCFTMAFASNNSAVPKTGITFAPTFDIDLRGVIEPKDMKKKYKVSFCIISTLGASTYLDYAYQYWISFNFGANHADITTNDNRNIPDMHGIIFIDTFLSATTPTWLVKMNTGMNDNPPIILDGLYGMNKLGWTIYRQSTAGTVTVVNPTDDGSFNSAAQYQLKLYFEEI